MERSKSKSTVDCCSGKLKILIGLVCNLKTMSSTVSLSSLTALNNNGRASAIPKAAETGLFKNLANKDGTTPTEKASMDSKSSHKAAWSALVGKKVAPGYSS
ncbi:hypothetical protein WICPIJ_000723 [Wickerhamomyces pijperi]|uniref:Uncharacterized protein n=1 Tax=Wickerhamomyces pijperi TaxID=599730 RepID=A0A9P8TRM8_WICPI|nr:hypothetical protein WICPIJ_000723 [Wickerhamomyces pijperi]